MVLVVVKVRKVNDARRLLAGNLHDSRVRMTQSVYSQPSHEVQVALPFEVVEKHALAPFNGNRIAVIGLDQKTPFAFTNFLEASHERNLGKQNSKPSRSLAVPVVPAY